MKKFIAIICVLILSLQVVPVRQIGAMLFNNQLTEEIAHNADCEKKCCVEKESTDYLPSFVTYNTNALYATNNHRIHAHTTLIQLHVAEVQTPPPDLI